MMLISCLRPVIHAFRQVKLDGHFIVHNHPDGGCIVLENHNSANSAQFETRNRCNPRESFTDWLFIQLSICFGFNFSLLRPGNIL